MNIAVYHHGNSQKKIFSYIINMDWLSQTVWVSAWHHATTKLFKLQYLEIKFDQKISVEML